MLFPLLEYYQPHNFLPMETNPKDVKIRIKFKWQLARKLQYQTAYLALAV